MKTIIEKKHKIIVAVIIVIVVILCVCIGVKLWRNANISTEAPLETLNEDLGNVADDDWTARY